MSTDLERVLGSSDPLGATPRSGGVNFAVHAPRATDVWVCLIDDDGAERRVRLPARHAGIHHGFIPYIGVGAKYVLRAAGPWDPDAGLRFNEHKALIDPYARRIVGPVGEERDLLAYDLDDPESMSQTDSLGSIPLSVVTADPQPPVDSPRVPWDRTVICELHVGSYTARHRQGNRSE